VMNGLAISQASAISAGTAPWRAATASSAFKIPCHAHRDNV
jgi:hypothetical protein